MRSGYRINESINIELHDYSSGQLKAVSLEFKDGTSVFIQFNDEGQIVIY